MFISSTGGHLNELLMLKSIFNEYDYSLITEYDKTTKDLGKKYKNVSYLVYGTKDHLFTYIFKFLWNIIKSIYIYIKYKPNVIVTTGTHTAVPMCYLGHWFGSKVIFIETFANSKTQTMSGKMIYPIADTFVVQWPEMKKLYPNAEVWGWIY
jgi:beta-1,4-N-acetylglucosaminyltransferase